MKHNRFYLRMFAIILLLTLQSCKKDSVEPQKETYSLAFTKKALEYVKLTEGKYLIYKDSTTSQLDSVIVTKSKLENVFNEERSYADLSSLGLGIMPATPAYYHEKFMLILTKFTASTQTVWFDGHADLELKGAHNNDTAAMLLRYPGYSGPVAFFLSETMTPDTSITVESEVYDHVVVTTHSNGFDPNSPYYESETHYWAKGIGIIKYQRIQYTGPGRKYTAYSLLRHN